jgi:hypothetical protein
VLWLREEKRKKALTAALGPLAAGVLLGWWQYYVTSPTPAKEIPVVAVTDSGLPRPSIPPARTFVREEPTSPDTLDPRNRLPPANVILTGKWSDEDRAAVQAALVAELARVPGARGKTLRVEGLGRPLQPTSHRVPRYGVTASWDVSSGPGDEVLFRDALPEIAGWGSTPDEARQHAALRAGKAVSTAVRRAFP